MKYHNTILHTDGHGYWSNTATAVRVVGFELGYVNPEGDFGELRVYFDENTWNTDDHGLIYTDQRFAEELRAWLTELGYASADVHYSEQGMQGEDYVSLDCDAAFINSYNRLTTVA